IREDEDPEDAADRRMQALLNALLACPKLQTLRLWFSGPHSARSGLVVLHQWSHKANGMQELRELQLHAADAGSENLEDPRDSLHLAFETMSHLETLFLDLDLRGFSAERILDSLRSMDGKSELGLRRFGFRYSPN